LAVKERISGLRRSARQLPGRTPLRVKLIAAMLVLVAAALAVISFAGIAFLRGYLLNQADQNLRAAAVNANPPEIVDAYLFLGAGPAQATYGGLSIQWLPDKGPLQQVLAEYSGFRSGQPHQIPGPAVRRADGWLYKPGPADRNAYNWLRASPHPVSAPVTVSASSGDGRWRVVSSAATLPSPSGHTVLKGTIILGLDVTSIYRTLNELTVIDIIVSAALLVVLAALGITVIRSSMRPLTDIERTARAIAAGDLGRRVPEGDPRTEVGKLGRSLNTMLAQIEAAFLARTASEEAARRSEDAARRSAYAASRSEERVRQFVADASHELRTPLTAIRGFAEYYRQRGGVGDANSPNADLDMLVERVEAEARRMGVLVDDMLLLARLDQQRPLDFRTVDLLAIAADALHDARMIAPNRDITLTVDTSDAPLVTGDEVGLRQVVANLISNAMTHTPDGTPIDITIRSATNGRGHGFAAAPVQSLGTAVPAGLDGAAGGGAAAGPAAGEPAVILEVADQGAGLNDEQKEHVFERFYRTDRARSRTAGGTGLGLAIVAAMISAHHGRVWVDSEPGKGATFGFALPLAPEARAPD
jgi:two-component system, OmpR family, sensor kinase